jgi:hypothetical protein
VSLYPCQPCGHRVPGALQSYRVTLLLDNAAYTRRVRVCQAHLDEALENTFGKWRGLEDVEGDPTDSLCSACGRREPSSDRVVVGFAWLYPHGDHPIELMTYMCEPCAAHMVADLGLERQEMRRTAP